MSLLKLMTTDDLLLPSPQESRGSLPTLLPLLRCQGRHLELAAASHPLSHLIFWASCQLSRFVGATSPPSSSRSSPQCAVLPAPQARGWLSAVTQGKLWTTCKQAMGTRSHCVECRCAALPGIKYPLSLLAWSFHFSHMQTCSLPFERSLQRRVSALPPKTMQQVVGCCPIAHISSREEGTYAGNFSSKCPPGS